MGRSVGVPPGWTSVLAVIAHPDDAAFGLGAILDAFVFAGAKVEVLCLTHGQAWTLEGAPGDLAALRGAELASAADVLGPARAEMADCPDGALGEVDQARLVDEVIASADSCFPDGLLVLGWALSEEVAAQLNHEFGNRFTSRQDEDVDLRVTVERAKQRMASHSLLDQAVPGSARWRRLELLTNTQSLRWLRPVGGAVGD